MYTVTGKLKRVGDEIQVSDKFTKRDFVVETDGQYPQTIALQLSQAKCDLIDPYSIGQEIKVHFNLRGREWTNPQGEVKCFNTLDAWKIEGEQSTQSSTAPEQPVTNPDDLPF